MKSLFIKTVVTAAGVCLLAACSSNRNAYVEPLNLKTKPEGIIKTYEDHNDAGLQINRIASELADQLIKYKVESAVDTDILGITTLVDVHSYNRPNELGRVLSEDLIHELHRRGENVLEYHLTGYVEVTKDGDIALSRKAEELAKSVPVSRFLIGTLAKSNGGYVVNARIVSLKTHLVESTAIAFVSDKLLPARAQPVVVIKNPQQSTVRGGLIVREDPALAVKTEQSRIK